VHCGANKCSFAVSFANVNTSLGDDVNILKP
jgi:hypothetical protein